MKNFNVLFFFIILVISCTDNQDLKKRSIPLPSTTHSDYHFFSAEDQIRDYWIVSEGRTWKDVDALYKAVVDENMPLPGDLNAVTGLDNFRASAIACMIRVYGLLEDTSDEAKLATAFYAKEMASISTCSPELLHPMLVQLKGYLPDREIAQIAQNGYEKSESLFAVMKKNRVPKFREREIARKQLKSLFTAIE